MNKYEIMFIVKPDVEEEARNTLIENFKSILTANGGTAVSYTHLNLITNKKGDIHGHGVKSIKRIVNEYNGNIKFFENGLKFHVSIIIPLNYPH